LSSREHEDAGDLNQALIDLDAALHLAQQSEPAALGQLADHQKRRRALAQREVEAIVDRLNHNDPSTFPLGDWLNLIARLPRDADLADLVTPVNQRFESALKREIDSQLSAARRSFESGQVVDAYRRCDRIARLIKHLEPEIQSTARSETEKLVTQIVAKHGLIIEKFRGTFVFGSQSSYVSDLMPILVEALEAKGYLPYRESSPWHDVWTHALYQLRLDVTERLEGSYLLSQNRLTWIEMSLSLSSRGVVLWHVNPTARSSASLPKLSAFVAGQLAASKRSDEVEKLLYKDARGQIEDWFRRSLGNMPPCPLVSSNG
jgi:hypothetical protein